MKKRIWLSVALLLGLGLAVLALLTYSSITATGCKAVVLGGAGTVADPLRIEVQGDCGLTPYIDSLLPFRAVPAIELSYKGERFYVPGLNKYFAADKNCGQKPDQD